LSKYFSSNHLAQVLLAKKVNAVSLVLQHLLAAFIAADRAGIIRFWNPGAARLFGYARQEALEQSLNLIIPGRLRQRHWDGHNQVIQTGHSRYADSDLLSLPASAKIVPQSPCSSPSPQ
jgi:PAS domain-containing protein